MEDSNEFVVVLTKGDEDGGDAATLAFACANAALAMGLDTTIFLVGKAEIGRAQRLNSSHRL